jgi:HK97 family phage portal protein
MIAQNSQHRILWLPGEERMFDEYGGGSRSDAGVRIDSTNAHQVASVFACLRVLAETVASLPLHVLERTPGGGKRIARELPLYRQLHSQPNGWQTSFEWREQAVLHLSLWGDAFSELKAGEIQPLHPSRMKIERIENGRLRYKYREEKGTERILSESLVLQVRGPSDDGVNGIRIVEECKEAIALARACEIHGARFFAAGARPGFILSTDGQLNAEAREALRSQWDSRHGGVGNSHNTAVLTGGLKPYDLPQASNTDSQFIELRDYQLAEIARLFRVPMHLLGKGAGSPQADIEFVTHSIIPLLRRFESAFMRDLIDDDDRYLIEFDVRGLLRGDSASRSAYYRSMWDIGVLNTDDIRGLENLDPVEGGTVRYRPLNMGTLGEQPSTGDVLAQQQPGSGIDGQAVEGGLAAAAAVGEPVADEPTAPQVADVSLNGAQITGLIAILTQIPAGLLTKPGAAALIAASFPSINSAQVTAILAGVAESQPAPAAVPVQPPLGAPASASPAGRSLGEQRAMTISIDFDRTFSADPTLWGEFAAKSVAEGNTVVMISRRPDTPEDRETITGTLGDYAPAFSQVLLVGSDTLKADAARAAGISVDVWVDDSPQYIRSLESRAAPDAVDTGDYVSWGSGDGRGRGRITRVVRDGEINVPDSSFTIQGTEDDPAALIRVYRELADGWNATDTLVGHRFSTLTKIDPLESRALGDIVEGDTVTWGEGLIGIVSHIMLTGTLNLGETEMEAMPDDPAVLVSLVKDGVATNEQAAVRLGELTKVEANAYGYGKPKKKPRGRKRGS